MQTNTKQKKDAKPIRRDKSEQSETAPRKKIHESIASLLSGNDEFSMTDQQKKIFERVQYIAKQSQGDEKEVIIIHANEGTGKTFVALSLLGALRQSHVSKFKTEDNEDYDKYKKALAETIPGSQFDQLFGINTIENENTLEILIADDLHLFQHHRDCRDEEIVDQVFRMILSAKVSIFFIGSQKVGSRDLRIKPLVEESAAIIRATTTNMRLN